MIKWGQLSRVQKVLTGTSLSIAVFVSITGFIIAAYSHFMPYAKAQEQHEGIQKELYSYQAQQYKADQRGRVDLHQREINRIEYQLLDAALPDINRAYLNSKITELREMIKCIRANQC